MKDKLKSPLTGSSNLTLINSININVVRKMYLDNYGLDIQYLIPEGYEFIERYRCNDSGLEFFYPNSIVGDSDFYNKLQEQTWYYLNNKWEFHEAINEFPQKENLTLLEIGCAKGDFLNIVRSKLPSSTLTGIELNRDAVLEAREKGLNVLEELSSEHSINNECKYDVIVSFQVLEHIANPLEILKDCIRMLKPGGRLIIGVPDNSKRAFPSLIVKSDTDLNMPPHHQGLWGIPSLTYLVRILPISLNNLIIEPAISSNHKNCYRLMIKNTIYKKYGKIFGLVIYAFGLPFIKYSLNRLGNHLPGHTILAVYTKNH